MTDPKKIDNPVTTTTENVTTTFQFPEGTPAEFQRDVADALIDVLEKYNKTGSTVTVTVS